MGPSLPSAIRSFFSGILPSAKMTPPLTPSSREPVSAHDGVKNLSPAQSLAYRNITGSNPAASRSSPLAVATAKEIISTGNNVSSVFGPSTTATASSSLPPLTEANLLKLYEAAKIQGEIAIHFKSPQKAASFETIKDPTNYYEVFCKRAAKIWMQIIEVGLAAGYPLNKELIDTAEAVGDFGFSGGAQFIAADLIGKAWFRGEEFYRLSGAQSPVIEF